ncbi:hypothetical protein N9043_00365 [bacterium]|nr:hypothetical protein [bacterium]
MVATTMLLTGSVFGGWTTVDHPYEHVEMYVGDKNYDFNNSFMRWIKVSQGDSVLHSLMLGSCEDRNYRMLRRIRKQGDKEESRLEPTDVKSPDGVDLMNFVIDEICHKDEDVLMCKPEDVEDLDRTADDEANDIVMSEVWN